jgi:cyclase
VSRRDRPRDHRGVKVGYVQRVSEHISVETGYHGSNNGVLDAGNGELVLFDAPQLPTDARQWAARVGALGVPLYLINTDHHPDHTVGNRWLGGVVVAHRGTRERLLADPPSVEYLSNLFGALDEHAVPLMRGYRPRLPEVTFDQRLDLWAGERPVQLLHAPGHTANTIMAYVPDEGVLFTGDNICEASLPAFVDASVGDFFDAIDLAETLPFEQLVPGHGKVSGRDVLERYRNLGRELVGRVARARERGDTRAECGESIRYEDHIHRDLDGLPDYPADLVDTFQRASIEKIFDDLQSDPSLADR